MLLLGWVQGIGQQRYTISGYVRDSLSRETLIGASLTIKAQGRGVNTNQYGFFSLTLPEGNYTLTTSFVGYVASEKNIELNKNIELDIAIIALSSLSQEIVISSRKRDGNVKNAQMGQIDLSMNKIRSLPVIFGEVDPLKSLQLLPGVRNAGEGNSGLYVRGGGPDHEVVTEGPIRWLIAVHDARDHLPGRRPGKTLAYSAAVRSVPQVLPVAVKQDERPIAT